MGNRIIHFPTPVPTPVRSVDLDRTIEMYTLEELVERERQIGNRDGLSEKRRQLVESLMSAENR